MSDDTILEMLRAINAKLDEPQPEKITVNAEEVAAMFGKKRSSGFSIVKNLDFPAPIEANGIARCWLREDVIQWAKRRKMLQNHAF